MGFRAKQSNFFSLKKTILSKQQLVLSEENSIENGTNIYEVKPVLREITGLFLDLAGKFDISRDFNMGKVTTSGSERLTTQILTIYRKKKRIKSRAHRKVTTITLLLLHFNRITLAND